MKSKLYTHVIYVLNIQYTCISYTYVTLNLMEKTFRIKTSGPMRFSFLNRKSIFLPITPELPIPSKMHNILSFLPAFNENVIKLT